MLFFWIRQEDVKEEFQEVQQYEKNILPKKILNRNALYQIKWEKNQRKVKKNLTLFSSVSLCLQKYLYNNICRSKQRKSFFFVARYFYLRLV